MSRVNGIDPSDLVLDGAKEAQVISGSKVFEENVVVHGDDARFISQWEEYIRRVLEWRAERRRRGDYWRLGNPSTQSLFTLARKLDDSYPKSSHRFSFLLYLFQLKLFRIFK